MLLLSIVLTGWTSCLAFDCKGTITYERTTGASFMDSTHLINERNITQTQDKLIYPCFEECFLKDACLAFEIDYDNRLCQMFSERANEDGSNLITTSGVHYFEKICINVMMEKWSCRLSWAIDRVIGLELTGNTDLVLPKVKSRYECSELCFKEQTFRCLCAIYNFDTGECNLRRQDRRKVPQLQTSRMNVNYLENQCHNVERQCGFKKTEQRSIRYSQAEIVTSLSYDQCTKQCLTEKLFNCRSLNYHPILGQCSLSADDKVSTEDSDFHKSQEDYYEEGKCNEVFVQCEAKAMVAVFKFDQPFTGRIFMKNNPLTCFIQGDGSLIAQLSLPLNGKECGVRNLGNGTFVTSLIIQHHVSVLRLGDMKVDVACDYDTGEQTIIEGVGIASREDLFNRSATISSSVPTPQVTMRITDREGQDIQEVRLGDKIYLRIETNDDSIFGIFARDLIAESGNGVESLILINKTGCPAEPSLLPSIYRIPGTKSLEAPVEVFRFYSNSILKFTVTVTFCIDECEPVLCEARNGRALESLGRKKRSSVLKDPLTVLKEKFVEDTAITMEMAIFVESDEESFENNEMKNVRRKESKQKRESDICLSAGMLIGLAVGATFLQLITLTSCVICTVKNRSRKPPEWLDKYGQSTSNVNLYPK